MRLVGMEMGGGGTDDTFKHKAIKGNTESLLHKNPCFIIYFCFISKS